MSEVPIKISPILKFTLSSVWDGDTRKFLRDETKLDVLLQFILKNRNADDNAFIRIKLQKHKYQKALKYLSRKFDVNRDDLIERFQYNWAKITAFRTITFIENLSQLLDEYVGDFRRQQEPPIYRFLSRLWLKGRPFMIVTTSYIDGEPMYMQISVMRVVSTFLYQLLVDESFTTSHVSVLLHSISAYAMKQKFPNLTTVHIPYPLNEMGRILAEAAQQYGFKISRGGRYLGPFEGWDDFWILLDEFSSIWKQWVVQDSSGSDFMYCNSCLKPTALMCPQTHVGYCDEECLDAQCMLIEGRKRGAEKPQNLSQTRTVEEARELIANGAYPYEYIGNGRVALDEMVKWYPIREFLAEARLNVPPYIEWLLRNAMFNTDVIDQNEWIVPSEILDQEDIHTPSGDIQLSMEIVGILIFHGFVPVFDANKASAEVALEHLFFRRYDLATLDFWLGSVSDRPWRFASYWVYRTYAGHVAMAEKTPTSLALLLFAPRLVYKKSKRAMTTMSQFRTVDSPTITSEALNNRRQFLRVTRYAAGMSKGLFHVDASTEDNYCGTFYYLEPESTTVLHFKNALYAFDKAAAVAKLGVKLENPWDVPFPENDDFMLTPKEYNDWLHDDETDVDKLQTRKFYAAAFPMDHYAHQDKYDQMVCNKARAQGYDVVVLTHMVGSHQIVTEVLDTRPREESLQNLYFIED